MNLSKTENECNAALVFYFMVGQWNGLNEMFESEDWSKMAGVPLVPLYWLRLAEKGHEVHVIATGAFNIEKDFQMKGVYFHLRNVADWLTPGLGVGKQNRPIRTYIKVGMIVQTRVVMRVINELAESSPPDVLYSYRSTFQVAGYLLSRKYNVPHIVHYWGTWLSHYLFRVPWYKRLPGLSRVLALKIPMDLLIISNDGTEGDKAIRKLNFPLDKFRFWLDGTAADIYKPDLDTGAIKKSIGLKPTDKMIFQAVRLDFWKRIDRSIDAMPRILELVPNAFLVVAGDGALRDDLVKQAKELDVIDHVKFLGFIPHNTVQEMHNAADLFLTVQDLTNLGNQIMEALHSRTCTVAYDVGGTSRVMQDGVTGALLNEESLLKLGDIVASLLLDDERRDRLAEGALEYAKQNIWTWDERIEVEIEDVNRLVKKHRNS